MENGQVRFSAQFALATMTVAIVLTGAHSAAGTPHVLQSQVKPSARFEEPVDINTATLEQLMKIPGLTRIWAARIIRFRPYRQKNELLDNGIVSSEVYARIKDHIIAHRQAR